MKHVALTVASWIMLPLAVAMGSWPLAVFGSILLIDVYVDPWVRSRR